MAVSDGDTPIFIYSTKETTFSMDSDNPDETTTIPAGFIPLGDENGNAGGNIIELTNPLTFASFVDGFNGVFVGQG